MSKNPLDNIEESIVESSLKYDDHDPKKRAEIMQWLTRSKEARAKANKRNFQPQKIKGKVYGAREFAFDTVKKTEPLKIDIEFPKFYKSEEQPQLPGINWNKLAKANGLAGMLGENTDTAIGVEDIDE